MEKNIVEVVMNNKGEVVEKVADYIGVDNFAKAIEALYRECLEDYENSEDMFTLWKAKWSASANGCGAT